MAKFNSETGKKAGALSKRGPGTKKLAWEKLGHQMISTHSGRVNKYLSELYNGGDKEKFMQYYIKILPYFRPTIQAHAIKQETEITVKVVSEDSGLMDKI